MRSQSRIIENVLAYVLAEDDPSKVVHGMLIEAQNTFGNKRSGIQRYSKPPNNSRAIIDCSEPCLFICGLERAESCATTKLLLFSDAPRACSTRALILPGAFPPICGWVTRFLGCSQATRETPNPRDFKPPGRALFCSRPAIQPFLIESRVD